jgi:outer membrane lipopolysaccharide assembly protein LptE/RlpB
MSISKAKSYLVLGLLSLTACGYHLMGSSLSSLPPRIQTIAVPMFKNTSGEPNLEKPVTEAVIQKFQSIGKPRLVEGGQADAVLLGTITRYTPSFALSFTSGQNVQEFRMEIVGDIVIKETATGKIIWQKKGLYSKREYTLAGQLADTKVRELEHKKLTAFEFARDLTSVLEGF